VFDDSRLGGIRILPDAGDQLVFGDRLADRSNEMEQDAENLGRERNFTLAGDQQTALEVEAILSKAIDARSSFFSDLGTAKTRFLWKNVSGSRRKNLRLAERAPSRIPYASEGGYHHRQRRWRANGVRVFTVWLRGVQAERRSVGLGFGRKGLRAGGAQM
jgi:hypothetical protein